MKISKNNIFSVLKLIKINTHNLTTPTQTSITNPNTHNLTTPTQTSITNPNPKNLTTPTQTSLTINKTVLSGIRATGSLHLGNYLGAIKGMLQLQKDPLYKCYFMVADVHSITTPYDPTLLKQFRTQVVKDYLAAGLDPNKSTIFIQSQVPTHLEMSFYLSSLVSVARMQHLPTYKEKVKQYPENLSMALLNYPVLMSADILAYKATHVPVGKDQEPHLEVTRQIARNINEKYNLNFPEPQIFSTESNYVPSLLGEGKMSKSIEGSYINLTDSLQQIQEKVAKIPTDIGHGKVFPKDNPQINSLFEFIKVFIGEQAVYDYKEQYVKGGIRYGDLKKQLSSKIFEMLQPIQQKRLTISQDFINDVLNHGQKVALQITTKNVNEIKDKMGF